MDTWLDIVRGLVRPIITVMAFGSVVVMILAGVTVPEWYKDLVAAIILWWFATRSAKSNGNGR